MDANIELAGLLSVIVVSVIGALKKALPDLQDYWTVGINALLCLGLGVGYAATKTDMCLFDGILTGLAAWVIGWLGASAVRWKKSPV